MSATNRQPVPGAHRAAADTTDSNSLRVTLPLLGTVSLPPPGQLAYLGGVGALVALELIEWPVGLTLAAGHLLATSRSNKVLRDFGQALEEA
jgi:hypothetical protein